MASVEEDQAAGRLRGRPTDYHPALGEIICRRIEESECGLHKILDADPELPHISTVMKWLASGKHPEFVERYALAKEAQVERVAWRGLEIVDEAEPAGDGSMPTALVHKAREQATYRRWLAERLLPKRYGNRVDIGAKEAAETLAGLVARASDSAGDGG